MLLPAFDNESSARGGANLTPPSGAEPRRRNGQTRITSVFAPSPAATSSPALRGDTLGTDGPDTPSALRAAAPTDRRHKRKWSREEEQLLCRLWHELGFQAKVEARARLPWKEMLDYGNAHDPGVFDACREPTHLKDKARNLGLLVTLEGLLERKEAERCGAAIDSAAVAAPATTGCPVGTSAVRAASQPIEATPRCDSAIDLVELSSTSRA